MMRMKKRRYLVCFLLSAMLLLSACGAPQEVPSEPAAAETVAESIRLVSVGDVLMHMPVIRDGIQEDGSYDFRHIFEPMKEIFRSADVAIANQETVFGGKEIGYSGYPAFNSPSEMGDALVDAGFDVILHATNHVMDRGTKGIESTLSFWEKYPEICVLGINESSEAEKTVDIIEVKGAKLALLNYTYGTNGIPVPGAKSYLVDRIEEEKIERDLLFAEENADFTVAFMHWGVEYNLKPSKTQKELAKKMCAWGADLIIGAHPHVVEPVEWIESENGNRALVYYSLGNFVSRQKEANNLLGAMADVTLAYDGKTVTVAEYSFLPIVTHYSMNYANFRVYPLSQYTDELAAQCGVSKHDGKVSVDRYQKVIQKAFDGYDISIVEGLVSPEEPVA